MALLHVVISTLVLCLSIQAQDPTPDRTRVGKSYYYFQQDGTAQEAKDACNSKGLQLVEIEEIHENQYIFDAFVQNKPDIWIGMNSADGLEWKWWDSGIKASFTYYCEGEGNGRYPNEFCAGLKSPRAGCWEDWPCSTKKQAFVCQKVLTCDADKGSDDGGSDDGGSDDGGSDDGGSDDGGYYDGGSDDGGSDDGGSDDGGSDDGGYGKGVKYDIDINLSFNKFPHEKEYEVVEYVDNNNENDSQDDTGDQDTGDQDAGYQDIGYQDTGDQDTGDQDTGDQDTSGIEIIEK